MGPVAQGEARDVAKAGEDARVPRSSSAEPARYGVERPGVPGDLEPFTNLPGSRTAAKPASGQALEVTEKIKDRSPPSLEVRRRNPVRSARSDGPKVKR